MSVGIGTGEDRRVCRGRGALFRVRGDLEMLGQTSLQNGFGISSYNTDLARESQTQGAGRLHCWESAGLSSLRLMETQGEPPGVASDTGGTLSSGGTGLKGA